MNRNPNKIEQLKREQNSKKVYIKKLQKRRFNDLFIIIMPLLILVVVLENYIVSFFSSSKTFIYFFSACLIIIVGLYLLIMKLKIDKIQKRVDTISEDLYKLMKLDSRK